MKPSNSLQGNTTNKYITSISLLLLPSTLMNVIYKAKILWADTRVVSSLPHRKSMPVTTMHIENIEIAWWNLGIFRWSPRSATTMQCSNNEFRKLHASYFNKTWEYFSWCNYVVELLDRCSIRFVSLCFDVPHILNI